MKYSHAKSRKATKWTNAEISWEDLVKRLTTTERTSEKLDDYMSMPKERQTEIKDQGGFVGGHLYKGMRGKGNVLCRSLVVLDLDNCGPGVIETTLASSPWKCCYHTTHKHRPEKPRLRLVFPLARDVSEEEYEPVARKIAAFFGIELFDPSTFEPCRMMFWPTTSADGEFRSNVIDGPEVDPDAILASYADWHDMSEWPRAEEDAQAYRDPTAKAEDPLAKEGPVGDFCRTYSVPAAIEKFLPEVYLPTDSEDRFTYAGSEGAAGLVVYDGKFAYSFHSHDPVRGRLLNAFDLVRLHLYGDLDENSKEGTPVAKLPSFKKMIEMVNVDADVAQQALERKAEAAVAREEAAKQGNWKAGLTYDKRGIADTIENARLILKHDPHCQGFAYNEFSGCVEAVGEIEWPRSRGKTLWDDTDTAFLKTHVSKYYRDFSDRIFNNAFMTIAAERAFHPIRDYLDDLPLWDGVPRVETLLINFLLADDTPLVRAVTRKTVVAAVTRIYEPGCKFDQMLVLDGPQGIGKSTIFRLLAGAKYYTEGLSLADMSSKDGQEKLQGSWFTEVSELAGKSKADLETVKSFITVQDDKYRDAYGHMKRSHPRQGVIFGTVNGENGYLRDLTGNRRYWIVKLHKTDKASPIKIDKEFRDQFWAEARKLYQDGETLYLEDDLIEAAEAVQHDAIQKDARAGMVEEYLDTLLPENWAGMKLVDRRTYLQTGENDTVREIGTVQRTMVCAAEIWMECFGREKGDLKQPDSSAISLIMEQIEGWHKVPEKQHRFPGYGKQRYWERDEQ